MKVKYKLKALAIAMWVAFILGKYVLPHIHIFGYQLFPFLPDKTLMLAIPLSGFCTLSLWILAEKFFFKLDRIEIFRPYIENYRRRRAFRQTQREWLEE